MDFKVECSGCRHSYWVHDGNPSEHCRCPNCHSTGLHLTVVVDEAIVVASDFRLQARDPSMSKTQGKRTGVDIKSGSDWWRDGGKFVFRYQEVNHNTNRYLKVVVDPEGGEVLRFCGEPLTEHRR